MNLYFLVEGKTESKVFPKWMSYLCPNLSKIEQASDVRENNYYLISGGGYPSIFDFLKSSIEDINSSGNYDYLILSIDADLSSVDEKIAEVNDFIKTERLKLENCLLHVVVAKKCLETWFLGNKKVYSRNPKNLKFIPFTKFYNVSENDPELMDKASDFTESSSIYHFNYLKQMLKEKNIN